MRRHADQGRPSRQTLKLQQRALDLQAFMQEREQFGRLHHMRGDVAHALWR
jgi:hypothetical protein